MTPSMRAVWAVRFVTGRERAQEAMEGVVEASPLPAVLLAHFGVLALLALKLVVVGCCYLLWVAVPREYAIGIPLGMALLGGIATGWNTTVLLSAS